MSRKKCLCAIVLFLLVGGSSLCPTLLSLMDTAEAQQPSKVVPMTQAPPNAPGDGYV